MMNMHVRIDWNMNIIVYLCHSNSVHYYRIMVLLYRYTGTVHWCINWYVISTLWYTALTLPTPTALLL